MFKLALMNIFSKKRYIFLFLYTIILGVLSFAIINVFLFTKTYESKIINKRMSENFATYLYNDIIDEKEYEKYDFINDVVILKSYSTFTSNYIVSFDDKKYTFNDYFSCYGIVSGKKYISNNVYEEIDNPLLYGSYPTNEDEMMVNEAFLKVINVNPKEIVGKEVEMIFPKEFYFFPELSGKIYLKKKLVGVLKNYDLPEGIDAFMYITSDVYMPNYFFRGYYNSVYYNSYSDLEYYHDTLLNDKNINFIHNKLFELSYLKNVKKYVSSFSGIIYVILFSMMFAVLILFVLNLLDTDKKNYNFRFIINSYGVTKKGKYFESVFEKLIIYIFSQIVILILTFFLSIIISKLIKEKNIFDYSITTLDCFKTNVPYFILLLLFVFTMPFITTKDRK